MTLPSTVVCKNLIKTFGQGSNAVEALRGVNLEVYPGELLMLMGPSGSGKTTLISIMAGILTPTSGECLIGGIDLQKENEGFATAYRGIHIGFVFQLFNLIPMLTCAENVAIPLLLQGIDKKTAQEKAVLMLEEVGIGNKKDISPRDLSGGQQQRVAIARAIIHNPDFIVCDEPTSSLDHEMGGKILSLLQKICKERKKTVIVVSHDTRITEFADRIVHLEDGKIVI